MLWPWLSISSPCDPSYGADTWRLRVSRPGCQVELTGSGDRWVLIEADCWEAASAGCTELFPAAPIVSRRLNPSKCLCALAVWSEGGGPRLEQGQTSPGCLHFPSLLSTHLPVHQSIHPSTSHPSTNPSIHPSIHPSIVIHSLPPSVFTELYARHCAWSSGGDDALRPHDGREHWLTLGGGPQLELCLGNPTGTSWVGLGLTALPAEGQHG